MRAFIIALVLCAAVVAASNPSFSEWKARYGKSYANHVAEAHAERNFLATLKRTAARNAMPGTEAVFGPTVFADLSPAEFADRYLMKTHEPAAAAPAMAFPRAGAPQSWNWANQNNSVGTPIVSPIKNQEQCGSCWAFSAVEAIESAWSMANNSLQILSPQQVVDCDTTCEGCNGGDSVAAMQYVMKAGGLETEANYPYTGEDGTCKAKTSLEVVAITGYKYATQSRSESQMLAASAAVGPLSICVSATDAWQDYVSGVMTKLHCLGLVNHCVGIVGWDLEPASGKPYWIVRNSWGTTWGLDGYILLEYNVNCCDLASEAIYATVA